MAITLTVSQHPTIDQTFSLTATSSPAVSTGLEIVRVHEDGSTHRLILTAAPELSGGTWAGSDRHAPFNQFFTYFANAGGQTGASAEQYLHSDHLYLSAAIDPVSVKVDRIRSLVDGGLVSRAVRLDILDSAKPIHRHDSPMTTSSGELIVQVDTPEQYLALRSLVEADEPILINTPYNDYELRWQWIQPKGITPLPVGLSPWYPLRDIAIPFETTAQPDVDAVSYWTVAKLASRYATVSAVAAAFSTVSNLALDRPG